MWDDYIDLFEYVIVIKIHDYTSDWLGWLGWPLKIEELNINSVAEHQYSKLYTSQEFFPINSEIAATYDSKILWEQVKSMSILITK